MNDPRLPLWVTPAKDEPAHGILIRLAERNGIESSTRIPRMTGLNLSRLRLGSWFPSQCLGDGRQTMRRESASVMTLCGGGAVSGRRRCEHERLRWAFDVSFG